MAFPENNSVSPVLGCWHREEAESVRFLNWGQLAPVRKTAIVSARFGKQRLKISSFRFDTNVVSFLANSRTEVERPNSQADAEIAEPRQKKSKGTRLKPSGDMVKLEDRLLFTLQPPLESILNSRTMRFPFKPFDFQYEGIAFLVPRYSAILADEMGLGKTMQAITAMRLLLRTGSAKRILLICPKPLVANWLREFATWAPEITVAAVHGNQASRDWQWKNDGAMVKIANYELMIRDEETVTGLSPAFDLVVLDEAQRVKNRSNSTSKVIQKIERKRSWALTGTPIENSIEDLVGICEFVAPGTVHSGMEPIQIRSHVSDLIVRRTKDLVMKDMPPRLNKDAHLALSPEQQATYDAAEKDGVVKLNGLGHDITIKHVFELVLRLKQICNFDPSTKKSSKIDTLKADMEEISASGQKAIVFSQWVDSLKEIAGQISQYNPMEYHGRVPSKQREPILKEFREDPNRHVLLMSYGAGSVGLNLQFCRYVFLFDRWWNPAVEDQAINRAHRIGAAGSVTITRMIMANTIEQRIHDILEAKRELFREILDVDRPTAKRGLSRDEIFGLFKLTTPDGKIFDDKK